MSWRVEQEQQEFDGVREELRWLEATLDEREKERDAARAVARELLYPTDVLHQEVMARHPWLKEQG